MKKLIFFAIMLISFQSFSQRPEELVRWLKTYHNETQVPFDTSGFSQLPPVANTCEEKDERDLANYHVADLNNDGFNDLVFSGPCMPYDQTVIYMNSGDGKLSSYDFSGKVVGFEKYES